MRRLRSDEVTVPNKNVFQVVGSIVNYSETEVNNTYIASNETVISEVEASEIDTCGEDVPLLSRTDLDSHSNMVVVGKHADMINDTGRRAEVSPFPKDYESLSKVPIVDAAIRHDCPRSE